MNIHLASDYFLGSNPGAIYLYLEKNKEALGINHLSYNSNDFSSPIVYPIDIAITNNIRCLNNFGKLNINTHHGNFFLGDTQPEPNIDISLAASNSEKSMMVVNGYKPQNVLVTGAARTDVLYNCRKEKHKIRHDYLQSLGLDPNKLTIVYAPTYDRRNFGVGQKSFFANLPDEQIDTAKALMSATKELDAQVIIRVHKYYKRTFGPSLIPEDLQEIFDGCVIQSNDTHPNSIPVLTATDILITDFSSIIADSLPMDIPTIFIEPHSGWKYSNKWHAPKSSRYEIGPVVSNPTELHASITNYNRINNIYKKGIKEIKSTYIPLFDGRCSERAGVEIINEFRKRFE